jgi:hypothetical protein
MVTNIFQLATIITRADTVTTAVMVMVAISRVRTPAVVTLTLAKSKKAITDPDMDTAITADMVTTEVTTTEVKNTKLLGETPVEPVRTSTEDGWSVKTKMAHGYVAFDATRATDQAPETNSLDVKMVK